MRVARRFGDAGIRNRVIMSLSVLVPFIGAIFSSVLALAVFARNPRSIAHGSFALGMLALGGEAACIGMSALASTAPSIVYWQKWRLACLAVVAGPWLVFSLSYSRGNHREFLSKWRVPVLASFILPIALALFFSKQFINRIYLAESSRNWAVGLDWAGLALSALVLIALVLTLMNLEWTFRVCVGTMRWRIKYMVLGLAVLFMFRVYTGSQALLFTSVAKTLAEVNAGALVVACLLISVSLWRSSRFTVDVYPSLTVLYGSFTVMLVGVYLLVVGVLAQIVTALGGATDFPLKAFLVLIAMVGLAVLVFSERIRQYSRRLISRHFRRPVYDYRQVWSVFSERISPLMEEPLLCRETARWVSDTFHVLSVTIWLVDSLRERLVFGASTSLPEGRVRELGIPKVDFGALVLAMSRKPFPVDIDESKEEWAKALRKCNPDFFLKSGNRICVPMVAGGNTLGLMALGDRVSGVPFSVEDLDLLKCIGDQVGGSLLGIQLSQRLLQAKEMEAFQTMSAFFIHDLKNTASMLSLMLQNIETHFDDPGFRDDALKAVSRSVNHLNELISRLGLLRQGLKLNLAEADLNEVVEKALAGLDGTISIKLSKHLGPVPKTRFDSEQIQKVILNLLLNAKDAVGANGEIRVETVREGEWAELVVADNGCGMESEFMARSLFRPFQTTKKKGIGIGLYHSKMIVEAHRGKIEVESEPGKGTTFRILLPITGEVAK